MFWKRRDKNEVSLIPVLPKNYRAIALEAIDKAYAPRVFFNKQEIHDFSEAGFLTQKEIRNCIDFEIRDGGIPILGFHDHPSQMWISESYKNFAIACEESGWLKVEGQAS